VTEFVQVLTAANSEDAARTLGRSAVEAKLAASAQIVGPVKSVFWHQNTMDTGEEWQVILMSTMDVYPELERHLVDHHEWTIPEVTAVPLKAGSARYLDWVRRSVSH
jgi:periplasmic divalent cation tolerance protein